MRIIRGPVVIAFISIFLSSPVSACEEYKSHTMEEVKEYRDVLENPVADTLDRIFSFEQLVCSDKPSLRNYALRQGLSKDSDALLRNQTMFRAMMQMKRVDVELGTSKKLTKSDKKFIRDNSGIYSKSVNYRSESEGCLSLYSHNSCNTGTSLFIKGDKVEYNFRKIYGEFRLAETGEMIGFLRVSSTSRHSRIPAVIKLY